MYKKNIEDFSVDIDNYINRMDDLNAEHKEYYELLQLGKSLASNDFSKDSNKDEIFNETSKKINRYRGEDSMKKSNRIKHTLIKVASFALVCILGISTVRTSFAQELVDKIVKTITLGHINIIEKEPLSSETFPVPEEFKGKLFDKDGNLIEEFSLDNPEKIYTVDGEEIDDLDFEKREIIIAAEEDSLIVKDVEKLNEYTCFEVVLPKYLPEGYKFDRAEFYRNDNGVVENTKYISLYFTNEKSGEYIYMQQRFADKETAYSTGAEKIEQLKINGIDAVFYDNQLDWEDSGVIYMLNGRGIIKDELVKIAESFK